MLIKIFDKLFAGKKPPEEIRVIAKFKELKTLISKEFNNIKMNNVSKVYKIKILNDCFKVSDLLNDIKLVKDFLKLLSKISIKRIIEYKK